METAWPPEYTIRKSHRAKRIHLKISEKGLEVVLPSSAKGKYVEKLINDSRDWIEETLPKFRIAPKVIEPPAIIFFRAIDQTWQVQYFTTKSQGLKVFPTIKPNYLEIGGDLTQTEKLKKTLQTWLKKQAKIHLGKLIDEISQEIGLPYSTLGIRNQSTRWGSCSIDKEISLNAKLLFLPENLTRYVIIHELCHTKVLDHSRRFWDLVGTFDPHYKYHRKVLQKGGSFVPDWAAV